MKLYFMKEDALTYFKSNVENNLKNYTTKDNSWIHSKYNNPFEEFKYKYQILVQI